MSDRLICPFCGDEMKLTSLYMDGNHRYSHKYIGGLSGGKDRCPFDGETLPLRALQEIHRTHKALYVAVDVAKEIDELLSSNRFGVKEVPLLNITQTKISMLLKFINIEQITALKQKGWRNNE